MKRWVSANAKSNAAILISTVALVVVGGGAFAAGTVVGKNSVGTAQIKPHSITMEKLARATTVQLNTQLVDSDAPSPLPIPEGYSDAGNGLAYLVDTPAEGATSLTLHVFVYQDACAQVIAAVTFRAADGSVINMPTSTQGAMLAGQSHDFQVPSIQAGTFTPTPFADYELNVLSCL